MCKLDATTVAFLKTSNPSEYCGRFSSQTRNDHPNCADECSLWQHVATKTGQISRVVCIVLRPFRTPAIAFSDPSLTNDFPKSKKPNYRDFPTRPREKR
jgi:hypothetical protein